MLQKTERILRNKGAAILAAGALIIGGLSLPAKAVIITSGQTLNTTGVTSVPSGPPLADSGNVPFAGKDSDLNTVFTGELDSQVYADPSTGGLDFVYNFSNDVSSPDYILFFSASRFSGYTTDADYLTGTGGVGAGFPTAVQRNSNNGGGTINFDYPGGVAPGANSVELVIKTNATSFTTGTVAIQDGGNVNVPSYAPVAIPEPATMAISCVALFALGSRRRRSAVGR